MSAAVATMEAKPVATTSERSPSPIMDLVSHAVQNGQPIEVIRELMAMSKELAADEARRAFDAAVADAKAEISEQPIIKNATGHNNKRYADFSAYAKVVDPILGRHGLSYRFRTEQGDRIKVYCVLSHKAGHSEENSLEGPADTSGSKNAIQAVGSTLTYLQRYSLVQALGLAASNDDDGRASSASPPLTEAQIMDLQSLVQEFGADAKKLCQRLKVEFLDDLPQSRLAEAEAMIRARGGRS